MSRPALWLLLIVALTGPLLTHAEAADDLARSLIAGRIEAPDGGVGDDPNVASVWRTGPSIDPFPDAIPAWDAPLPAHPSDALPPDPGTQRRGRCRDSWPYPTAPRRAAWLQVFLI